MRIINKTIRPIEHLLLSSWFVPRLPLALMVAATVSAMSLVTAAEHAFQSAWTKYDLARYKYFEGDNRLLENPFSYLVRRGSAMALSPSHP